MLQNPKVLQSTIAKCLLLPQPTPPTQIQNLPIASSSPPSKTIKPIPKLSRRDLAICTKSSLLLILASQAQNPFHPNRVQAEEITENAPENAPEDAPAPVNAPEKATVDAPENGPEDAQVSAPEVDNSNNKTTEETFKTPPTKRAFLDVSINGEPMGRIVVALDDQSAPGGAARFSSLVSGAKGVTYRRKEFVKITPNYVQHGGVRSFGVDAELAKQTGGDLVAEELVAELEKANGESQGTKNVAGSVGIIVRDPNRPPPKVKLVARKGKLEIDEEEVGTAPNGTEFVITMKDSPELDAAALVIGRVMEGMEVVEKIGQVKTVQENTSSPYFRVAKLIGDKRAVVAERGFNRPYAKVVITNCGLLQ